MALDPDLYSAALLQRLQKELTRQLDPAAAPTELAGGWAKIGAALDHFALALLEQVGGHEPTSNQGRGEATKATAGPRFWALKTMLEEGRVKDAQLGPLAGEFRAWGTLSALVELRNAYVHDRPTQGRDYTLKVLGAAIQLLQQWRAFAGYP